MQITLDAAANANSYHTINFCPSFHIRAMKTGKTPVDLMDFLKRELL